MNDGVVVQKLWLLNSKIRVLVLKTMILITKIFLSITFRSFRPYLFKYIMDIGKNLHLETKKKQKQNLNKNKKAYDLIMSKM